MDRIEDASNAQQINAQERRRSSLDKQFSNMHALKREKPDNMALKESLHEQYAPTGMVGQAWNKFARGIGMQAPK